MGGGGVSAHGPRRLMGNYFRQIYTGSGAEWWTSTLAGCRGGGGGGGGVSSSGVGLDWVVVVVWGVVGREGGVDEGDGGQLVARKEGHVINWRSRSGSASASRVKRAARRRSHLMHLSPASLVLRWEITPRRSRTKFEEKKCINNESSGEELKG